MSKYNAEYYLKHKDKIKEQKKKWYEDHKEERKKYREDHKEQSKKWYEEHKEHMKERNKKWYGEHKEHIKERNKKWYEEHKEHMKERKKKWYEQHKDKIKEQRKKWYEDHKEQSKKWYKDHKEERKKYHITHQYGLSLQEYNEILLKQNYKCAICGKPLDLENRKHTNIDHDHMTGVIRGILCNYCNSVLGYAFDNPDILQNAQDYILAHSNNILFITESD